ncbi:rpp14 protein family [Niveomyces insectorum RCEF 264]|uniref:Ribonuclease P/MRP protein subunit POP5 n=1 Tax=Niveomyces insectorum RCEF 264 TaxID=1081102 RepID=A0A167USC4_9HYPO|nr:rpp14 protein family [Niveomyces insectorum RCEF 264]
MVRIKERYLLVNIVYPRDPVADRSGNGKDIPDFVAIRRATQPELTPQLLLRGIKAEVQALFGDCGAGVVGRTLSVKYLSKPTSTFILRITREHLRYVWSALTFLRHVPVRNGRPCIFRVARVSGTIRKVEEEAIRQARALALATKAYMAGRTATAFELLTRPTGGAAGSKDFLADVVSEGENDDDDGGDEDVGDDDQGFNT